jgi:hypothetical protein
LLKTALSPVVPVEGLQGGQLEKGEAVGWEPPFREDLNPEAEE